MKVKKERKTNMRSVERSLYIKEDLSMQRKSLAMKMVLEYNCFVFSVNFEKHGLKYERGNH